MTGKISQLFCKHICLLTNDTNRQQRSVLLNIQMDKQTIHLRLLVTKNAYNK